MAEALNLIRDKDVYRCGELTLCPFPPEHVLVELYADWFQSGVLRLAFYEQPMSLRPFLNLLSDDGLCPTVLGAYRKVEGVDRAIGLVWINKTYALPGGFSRAEVAMAFRRKVPPSTLFTIGNMAIEWGFTERKLDALIGTTPVRNRAAWLFGKRLGFTVIGPAHGMCQWAGNMEDVMISSMTRPMWNEISPFKTEPDGEELLPNPAR